MGAGSKTREARSSDAQVQESPQQQRADTSDTLASLPPPAAIPTIQRLSFARLAPPGSPVQREAAQPSAAASTRSIHAAAAAGVRGPGSSLPHLQRIQRALPEHDLSRVRAYTDSRAASASRSIGASAYAVGERVAFTERRPSLHTATHEAAHVLQQRAGVQLKGGVGQVGDPYERNADAIADAVVAGRTPPPVLGGGGSRSAIQRLSRLGTFVNSQRSLMEAGRDELPGKHTTVGFEFEFATMADGNPFSGLSHVEIAESAPMPDPAVPFILETDASNALELVSPPFWIPTFGDHLLPEPDRVEGVIDMFKERLDALVGDGTTIGALATTMASEDAITFGFKNVSLGRENLTHRTKEDLDVSSALVLAGGVKKIRLASITKFGGAGIDAQVNIATDAFGNDLLNQAFVGDRFSDTEHITAFEGLERAFINILYKKAFSEKFGWARKLAKFGTARSRVITAYNCIFNALRDARKKLRERVSDAVEEPWYPDFILETISQERMQELDEIVPNAVIDKLKAYNASPDEVDLVLERLVAYRDAAHLFITTAEIFLNTAHGAGPSTFGTNEIRETFTGIDRRIGTARTALSRVPHIGSGSPKLRIFLNALARAMSGQISVISINAVREAQEERFADPKATMGKGAPELTVHQFMSSRVKDVRGVWAKAPVLDIGLGLLSFKDWESVSTLVNNVDVRRELADAVTDVSIDYRDADRKLHTYTFSKGSIEPLVLSVVDGIKGYIAGKKLVEKSKYLREHTVKGVTRRGMSVMPERRPDFMSHDESLMTPRQDTFVPLKHVQMPEVWSEKSRQFVVESRTNPVETLRRIKRWTG